MIVSPYNTFLSPLCSRNLPNIIPVLQNQQANLTFLCESNTVPEESIFFEPLRRFNDTVEFLADELVGDRITEAISNGARVFEWINDVAAKTHFELQTNGYADFEQTEAIASKLYCRGLILITIYFEVRRQDFVHNF